jgi:hypothetical protein
MKTNLGKLVLGALSAFAIIFNACSATITPGQTLTGTIALQGQMTTYTFSANAGDAVTILISKSTGSLWPLIELHAPGGSIVTSESGSVSAVIQAQQLTQTGTYTILCRDGFNGTYTGEYALSLIKNPGPNLGDADGGAIQSGETKTGGNIALGDIDTYTFTATAGDAVTILMAKNAGSLWPLVELHAPDGSIVASEASSTSAVLQSQKLTQTGTYLILCRDGFNGTFSGGYAVSLVCFGCPTQPDLSLRVQDGSVQLFLHGDSGSSYLIQSSTDLIRWSDVGVVVAIGGVGQSNPPVSGAKQFYRALLKL